LLMYDFIIITLISIMKSKKSSNLNNEGSPLLAQMKFEPIFFQVLWQFFNPKGSLYKSFTLTFTFIGRGGIWSFVSLSLAHIAADSFGCRLQSVHSNPAEPGGKTTEHYPKKKCTLSQDQ
jgi:hypothetical protein